MNFLRARSLLESMNFSQSCFPAKRFSGDYYKVRRPHRQVLSTKDQKLSEFPSWGTKVKEATAGDAMLKFIRDKIRATGPITIAEYMQMCLAAPDSGYYASLPAHKIIGEQGDFITSPEISQIFGELIAVWIMNEVANMGHEGKFQLIELGPGTGALAEDILRVFQRFQIISRVSLHLVEISDHFVAQQKRLLCGNYALNSSSCEDNDAHGAASASVTKFGCPVFWEKEIETVPPGFSVVLAHEFFDALPVHCFQRNENGDWREVCVDLVPAEEREKKEDQHLLRFVLARGETIPLRLYLPKNSETRSCGSVTHCEISPRSSALVDTISRRIARDGGTALIIDYGYSSEDRTSSSLRAFKNHKMVHPLSDPGKIDLTADVNFPYLRRIASENCLVFGPIPQRKFLTNMGVDIRMGKLKQSCSREQASQLDHSYSILMGETDMGERFKVMCLFPKTMRTIFDIRKVPCGFYPIGTA